MKGRRGSGRALGAWTRKEKERIEALGIRRVRRDAERRSARCRRRRFAGGLRFPSSDRNGKPARRTRRGARWRRWKKCSVCAGSWEWECAWEVLGGVVKVNGECGVRYMDGIMGEWMRRGSLCSNCRRGGGAVQGDVCVSWRERLTRQRFGVRQSSAALDWRKNVVDGKWKAAQECRTPRRWRVIFQPFLFSASLSARRVAGRARAGSSSWARRRRRRHHHHRRRYRFRLHRWCCRRRIGLSCR